MPIWENFIIPRLTFDLAYLCARSEDFSQSRDVKEDPKCKMGMITEV